jgi:formylglycine-generating enzyme required for sulfatase activity
MAACALASAAVCAMPTKRELAEAQKPVSARMAQELRAFAAGTKTAAETFAALRNRAAEAEKESVRYLLLQGAFKIAARDGDYDAAADILNQMQREITDIPHAVIVELVEGETRTLAPGCAPQLTAFLHEPPPERTFKFGRDVDIPLHNGGKMEFVACPAGTFRMGRMGDRDPKSPLYEHAVTISRPFWIGRFPVTVEQWTNVMGRVELSEAQRAVGPRMPINRNRYAIEALAKTLTRMAADRLPPGYVVRLPTEAEWEYACRAGTTTAYNNGKDFLQKGTNCPELAEVATFRFNSGGKRGRFNRTKQVATRKPNAWGFLDMHGNVAEWCDDNYTIITPPVPENEKKSKKSKKQEPSVVNDKASEKIIRGGSFMSMPQFCRAAYRGSAEPVTRSNTIGFRVVLATQPPPPPVAKPQ